MSQQTAHQIIEDLLTLPELEEDSLDYMGCMGALAAFAITPLDISSEKIATHILDEAISAMSAAQLKQFNDALTVCLDDIVTQLEGEDEEGLELPWMEDEDDDEALISWAAGFIEVVFEYETLWLNGKFEEEATQLLMPIIAISGILEEETEELTANDEVFSQWIEEIPDLLVDLFLMFRITEDKKGPSKKAQAPSKGGSSLYGPNHGGKKSSNGPKKNNQKSRGGRGKKK